MRSTANAVPFHTVLRIATILFVAAVAASTRGVQGLWLALVLSVGFGHYALSVIYAKEPIRRVVARPQSIAALVAFSIVCYALYAQKFSLLIAFGVHHVFNEVYLPDRVLNAGELLLAKSLRFARIALNFFIFFVLVRNEAEMRVWNRPVLYAGLVASAIIVFVLLFRLRNTVARHVFVDLCAFEVVGLGMVALSFVYRVQFLHVVLYHFVFWAFYPVPKMLGRGAGPAISYVGLNILLTAGFLLLSPVSPLVRLFTAGQWYDQFRFWSYFHIATAFALSTAFPGWITRWFKAPVAAAVSGARPSSARTTQ